MFGCTQPALLLPCMPLMLLWGEAHIARPLRPPRLPGHCGSTLTVVAAIAPLIRVQVRCSVPWVALPPLKTSRLIPSRCRARSLLQDLVSLPLDLSARIAEALVAYGQCLYRAGQPYYKYSETINAVASLRPAIRKNLTLAWDLAFA